MLWRARRLRCGARPDLSGAWCSLPRSYVFHEDGNSSLMSVFIALMSAPAGASLKLPQATKLVPGRGFWPAMAPDGLPGASRSVMSGTIRCVFNYVRRVTSLGDGMIMPAAGCGPRPGRVLRPLARPSCCPGTTWLCGRYALPWVRPGRRFVVPGGGRLAQRESASFTPRRSLVRSQYRPPAGSWCQARSEALRTGLILLRG